MHQQQKTQGACQQKDGNIPVLVLIDCFHIWRFPDTLLKRLCQNLIYLIINDLKFIYDRNCPHLKQELSAFDTVPFRLNYLNDSVSNYYLAGMFMDETNGICESVDLMDFFGDTHPGFIVITTAKRI